MRIVVIIQARMGSTRLPGKVLLPLGKYTALEYVVQRCQRLSFVEEVIVATSNLEVDNPIDVWCREHRVICFRGSEKDVLSRYYECAKQYNPDYVIRVTSDCPFIDYNFGSMVIGRMLNSPADLVVLEGSIPRGLTIEMLSYSALKRIHEISTEPRHREHVTYYAYEYPKLFTRTIIQVPEALRYPELRITLDTEEDYELCKAVATAFPGRIDVSTEEVVNYLRNHPEIALLNQHIEQKPVV